MAKPFKPAPGIGQRLLELRGNMSREKFADLLDIHHSTVGNYERGDRKIDADFLTIVADRTSVDLNWLITGEGTSGTIGFSEDDQAIFHRADYQVSIPRYAIDAAAGDGSVALSQDIEDYFVVSRDWITRFAPAGARLGVLQARGDSMEPTIISGDALIVLFDITRLDINEGGVFVFSDGNGIKVKRFQILLDGRLRISSDNERYEPEYVDQEYADEHLTIHAKVLLKTGPL